MWQIQNAPLSKTSSLDMACRYIDAVGRQHSGQVGIFATPAQSEFRKIQTGRASLWYIQTEQRAWPEIMQHQVCFNTNIVPSPSSRHAFHRSGQYLIGSRIGCASNPLPRPGLVHNGNPMDVPRHCFVFPFNLIIYWGSGMIHCSTNEKAKALARRSYNVPILQHFPSCSFPQPAKKDISNRTFILCILEILMNADISNHQVRFHRQSGGCYQAVACFHILSS